MKSKLGEKLFAVIFIAVAIILQSEHLEMHLLLKDCALAKSLDIALALAHNTMPLPEHDDDDEFEELILPRDEEVEEKPRKRKAQI